jgi:hypothetical protein
VGCVAHRLAGGPGRASLIELRAAPKCICEICQGLFSLFFRSRRASGLKRSPTRSPSRLRFGSRTGVEAGREFEIERLDRGECRLVRRTARPNEGVVDWLLACPEKGFFVPVESESTDSL